MIKSIERDIPPWECGSSTFPRLILFLRVFATFVGGSSGRIGLGGIRAEVYRYPLRRCIAGHATKTMVGASVIRSNADGSLSS